MVVTLQGNPCFIAAPSKGLKRFLFSCMREMNKKGHRVLPYNVVLNGIDDIPHIIVTNIRPRRQTHPYFENSL